MPIYALGDKSPVIHESAFVHPDAVVIGSVTIGADSSIWACAVLRGDEGEIVIGERTSIQDGTIVHTTPYAHTTVGNDCVVGHAVHLEGCTLENGSQASSGSVILHRAVVGAGAIVAANAVVLNDMVVPPGALAVGAPVSIKEGRARAQDIAYAAEAYVHKGRHFKQHLRRID